MTMELDRVPRFVRAIDERPEAQDVRAALRVASSVSDLTLVLEHDGTVADVSWMGEGVARYAPDGWVGRAWADVVTPESRDKVASLLEESEAREVTRRRQINHPGRGDEPDLPVDYVVVRLENAPWIFALGVEQLGIASTQERLVRAQMELEAEYRRVRDAEARYRSIVQTFPDPILVVDGDDRRVLEANAAAVEAFGGQGRRLVGEPVPGLVDRADREALVEALSAAHHRGEGQEVRVGFGSGDAEPRRLSIEPYREAGRNNMVLRVVREGEAAPDSGKSAESRRTTGLDALPEAVAVIDAKGVVRDLNGRFLDLVRAMSRDRVIGRHLNLWMGSSAVDLQVLLSRLQREPEVRQFHTVIRDETGLARDVIVSARRDEEGRIALIAAEAPAPDTTLPEPGDPASASELSKLVGRVPIKDLIRDSVDIIEKLCIETALRKTRNNRASAADMLGMSRQSLYIKLRRYGLEDFDGSGG